MNRDISLIVGWALVLLCTEPIVAQPTARELLDKARDFTAAAPAITRVDTTEQSVVLLLGEQRLQQKPQTSIITIEILMPKLLARYSATIQGQQLIMLKQAEAAAMKLGEGPWQIPAAPYDVLARDLGNLFVCEIETPETKDNAPVWKVAGLEVLDGRDAYVIVTEGNSGAALAEQRMIKGLAKASVSPPPSIRVLDYSAKHWIDRTDYRHLKAEQKSKIRITLSTSAGIQQVMEQSSTATSVYRYDPLDIQIPEDVKKLLSVAK